MPFLELRRLKVSLAMNTPEFSHQSMFLSLHSLIISCIIIMIHSVKQRAASIIKLKFQKEFVSILETFDVKFTNPREAKRNTIDVRVKFEQGRPNVLLAKKNETKIVVFDVLNLHR